MNSFQRDRLENERNEPTESSSLKFINVPLVLFALFLGFGITYLALRTDKVTMEVGDSRTLVLAKDQPKTTENSFDKGKQIYSTTCQACHQASGAGIPGAFPPLALSPWVSGPAKRFVAIVLHGIQGEISVLDNQFQGVMPPFKAQLSAEDIAAVTSFVRQSFGNKAEPISPDLVHKVIKETETRSQPWAGQTELNTQTWD